VSDGGFRDANRDGDASPDTDGVPIADADAKPDTVTVADTHADIIANPDGPTARDGAPYLQSESTRGLEGVW
jgi:hypothetical protein